MVRHFSLPVVQAYMDHVQNNAEEAIELYSQIPSDSPLKRVAELQRGLNLADLDRHDEAIKQFDDVVKRAGSGSIYGRMARLGKADTQARAGQVDAAIVTWKEMAASTTGEFPVDAILMELARAYAQKGEKEEARKTFSQLIDQHPNSPYTSEARTELENLKS